MPEPSDEPVLEGRLVQRPASADASPPRPAAVVDSWTSVAPKQASRTVTLIALAPLLLLPLVLLATRLPGPIRPLLVIAALVLTGYSFYRARKPSRTAYRVETGGISIRPEASAEIRLPFDSLADLRILLTEDGYTSLAFNPCGPYEAPGRTKSSGGLKRIQIPVKDAARIDAAVRRVAPPGYRGIVQE